MTDNIDAIVERSARAFRRKFLELGRDRTSFDAMPGMDVVVILSREVLQASGLLDRIATLEAEITRLKYPKPLPRIIDGISTTPPSENSD